MIFFARPNESCLTNNQTHIIILNNYCNVAKSHRLNGTRCVVDGAHTCSIASFATIAYPFDGWRYSKGRTLDVRPWRVFDVARASDCWKLKFAIVERYKSYLRKYLIGCMTPNFIASLQNTKPVYKPRAGWRFCFSCDPELGAYAQRIHPYKNDTVWRCNDMATPGH